MERWGWVVVGMMAACRSPASTEPVTVLLAPVSAAPRAEHAREQKAPVAQALAIAIDVSGSMRGLVESPSGRSPRTTRLDLAKEAASRLAEDANGEVVVVVFAKEAFKLSALGNDAADRRALIKALQIGAIDPSGTALGDGVAIALSALRHSDAPLRRVIVLTDGNTPDGEGVITPDRAALLAHSLGVTVDVLQVDDRDEVEIEEGTDMFGQPRNARASFPTNDERLRELATDSGGRYVVLSSPDDLDPAIKELRARNP
jgi:Ca-activated chloride channel family protein